MFYFTYTDPNSNPNPHPNLNNSDTYPLPHPRPRPHPLTSPSISPQELYIISTRHGYDEFTMIDGNLLYLMGQVSQ